MSLLEISHLTTKFETQQGTVSAVRDVSYHLEEGEVLGIVGESGSGKSVGMLTLMGLLASNGRVEEGEILFDGENISPPHTKDRKEKRAYEKKMQQIRGNRIGMIFQDPMASLNPRKKVRDILGEGLDIHHLYKTKEERETIIKNILAKVGLAPEHAARYPHQFSGGQRQRVGIARALIMNPKLIIADEPVSALDVSIQAQVLNLLQQLQKDFNLTYLFISHDLSVVEMISDRIGVMYLGGLVETGTTSDIFANPQSEVAKELIRKDTGSDIGADSRPDAGREKGQAEIKSGEKIRIVFSENSAFEPVIANLILTFGEPVNILKADTKNVGGVAKGEMILEFMEGSTRTEMMKQYLKEKGLAIGEVTEYVGS